MTLPDEEHDGGAGICLERGRCIAPFAITCGMDGWFFHTAFFPGEREAERAFEEMKRELDRMIGLVAESAAGPEQDDGPGLQAISNFVERFP